MLLVILISTFMLFSCSDDNGTEPSEDDVIIPETTKIVETEEANASINDVQDNTIYMDKDSGLADFNVGGTKC